MIFLEAQPRDPASGLVVSVRAVSAHASAAAVNMNGLEWIPAISRAPRYSIDIFGSELTGALRVDYGEIGLRFSPQLGNDDWSRLQWDGAPLTLWQGDGTGLDRAEAIFTGRAGPMERTSANVGRLSLRGAEAQLDRPLLTATYAGTGGAEGSAALLGAVRPWCSGVALAVAGVLIDPVYWVWQVHGYGAIHAVLAAYEMGVDKGAPVADYPDYAALTGASLSESEWATCLAEGLVRFGGEPIGRVCFDVEGAMDAAAFPKRIGAVAAHLLAVAGVDGTHISAASASALDSAFPHDWGIYVAAAATIGDVLRQALSDVAGYAFPDGAGVWRFGRFRLNTVPTLLSAARNALPLVRDIRQVAAASPAGEVRVGGARCWSVHDASEISPALLDALNNPVFYDDITGEKPPKDATRNLPLGDWSSATAYKMGDTVSYMGRSFMALQDNTNHAPPNANSGDAYWMLLAGKGDKGEPGPNAITLSLSKAAITVYTHADGSGGDYSMAVGKATLRDGASDVTSSASLSTSTSNVTGGIDASGNYAVAALSADSGTLTIAADYKGETYTADVTVNRITTGWPKFLYANLSSTGLQEGDIVVVTDRNNDLYTVRNGAWDPLIAVGAVDGLADVLNPLRTSNEFFDLGRDGWANGLADSDAKIPTSTMTAAATYSGAQNVLTFGTTRGNAVSWQKYAVLPGRTYRAQLRIGISGNSLVYAGIQTNDANGPLGPNSGHIYNLVGGAVLTPGWKEYEAVFTTADLPAGTTSVRLVAYCNYDNDPAASGALDYLRLKEGLQVDEVDADSIGTAQLKAGAVTADELAANSVSSQKVGTNKLSANVVDIDGITLFNSGGQLAIKSAGVDTEQLAFGAALSSASYEASTGGFVPDTGTWANVVLGGATAQLTLANSVGAASTVWLTWTVGAGIVAAPPYVNNPKRFDLRLVTGGVQVGNPYNSILTIAGRDAYSTISWLVPIPANTTRTYVLQASTAGGTPGDIPPYFTRLQGTAILLKKA